MEQQQQQQQPAMTKLPIPPLPATAYTAKTSKKRKSGEEIQAKKKELDRARNKTRVNIGDAFQKWRELRDQEGLQTDAELAILLLDRYFQSGGQSSSTPSKRKKSCVTPIISNVVGSLPSDWDIFETEHYLKQEKRSSEYCCVPRCLASSKFNGALSFHNFPTKPDLRRRWLVNIRRDNFTVASHIKVCSRHFAPDQVMEPTTADGRRGLVKGAVPTLFEWNSDTIQIPRRSVRGRHTEAAPPEEEEQPIAVMDHDYCSVPEPPVLDISSSATEEREDPKKEQEESPIQREFGLQRFAGSDADIRFYTRFSSYDHMMAFWSLIEPSVYKMIRVSRAKSAADRNEEVVIHARPSTRQLLQPIDEFFLFLVFLSVGLKERDLAHRFNIHQSTVSRIIATWTSFLATALGSVCIWLTPAEVQAYLPEAFREYPDTQVILDCTELRCQTPSSPLLQSEMYSTYKFHSTMKALVGVAPHGAVTFISDLYGGSVSDKEIFKQSGIAEMLTEDVAVMADKSFQINDCCRCKVYCPPFLSKQKPAYQVKETQAIAGLRVHVERVIRRIKQNKLFDGVILLSHAYNINQLFAVACLLSNYQNKALVKKWVK